MKDEQDIIEIRHALNIEVEATWQEHNKQRTDQTGRAWSDAKLLQAFANMILGIEVGDPGSIQVIEGIISRGRERINNAQQVLETAHPEEPVWMGELKQERILGTD